MEIFDDRELTPQEIAEKCAKIDERIEKVVQETKDLPNVIGYYIVDEPGAYKFKALAAAVAAVKKYAPGKLAYINLYPGYASTIGADVDSQLGVYSYEEYLERFVQEVKPQFLSYDNYMIEYSEDMRDFSRAHVFFTDLFTVRRIALKYNLPIWFIGSSLCITPNPREIGAPVLLAPRRWRSRNDLVPVLSPRMDLFPHRSRWEEDPYLDVHARRQRSSEEYRRLSREFQIDRYGDRPDLYSRRSPVSSAISPHPSKGLALSQRKIFRKRRYQQTDENRRWRI